MLNEVENKFTHGIRVLMSEFEQSDSSFDFTHITQLNYEDIPIEPDLMYFLFKNVLKFDIRRRIYEKVDYVISFKYKNHFGKIGHYKLSYRLYLEDKIKCEVLEILKIANELLESSFIEYSKTAIKYNKFSLPNHYDLIFNKLNLIRHKVEDLNLEIQTCEAIYEKEAKLLIDSGEAYKEIVTDHGKFKEITNPLIQMSEIFESKRKKLEQELSYNIEFYIECFYSLLEHICCIICPMTNHYSPSEEYSLYLKKDWREKICRLLNQKETINAELIEKLSFIKEVYRNRFSHGMFSREKEINVQIPSFGMYPIWIGNKIKGFRDSITMLDYSIFQEINPVFEATLKQIEESYELQYMFLEALVPTFLDTELYGDAFLSKEKCEKFIDTYWYNQDNLLNMDW